MPLFSGGVTFYFASALISGDKIQEVWKKLYDAARRARGSLLHLLVSLLGSEAGDPSSQLAELIVSNFAIATENHSGRAELFGRLSTSFTYALGCLNTQICNTRIFLSFPS